MEDSLSNSEVTRMAGRVGKGNRGRIGGGGGGGGSKVGEGGRGRRQFGGGGAEDSKSAIVRPRDVSRAAVAVDSQRRDGEI